MTHKGTRQCQFIWCRCMRLYRISETWYVQFTVKGIGVRGEEWLGKEGLGGTAPCWGADSLCTCVTSLIINPAVQCNFQITTEWTCTYICAWGLPIWLRHEKGCSSPIPASQQGQDLADISTSRSGVIQRVSACIYCSTVYHNSHLATVCYRYTS